MSRKPEDGDASLSYKKKAGGERWETAVGRRQGRTNGKDMMKRMTAEAYEFFEPRASKYWPQDYI